MIFKGFTDENGNVIPIQGAGTVYNEEKNSLALGKGTSAIGQNQLVFGRYNEEDATKGEIVGGGSEGTNPTGIRITGKIIKSNVEYNVEVLAGVPISKEDYDFESDTDVPGAVKSQVGQNSYFSEVAKIESISGVEGLGYTHYYVSGICHTTAEHKPYVLLYYYDSDSGNAYTDGIIQNFQIEYIGSAGKNIRTLDWNGTQWNAGDITCDDGNGNTISMRDLLSRITTLEAAAANS